LKHRKTLLAERAKCAAQLKTWHMHIAIVALLAAYFLIFPVYRAFYPLEIGASEGWIVYHQDAILAGNALYPAPDSLTQNNYPPLSFYVVAVIASWTGDSLFVGRILSIVATLGLGWTVALVIRQLGGGRIAGAIGGIWFVAFMVATFDAYVGVDEPQLFGQFIMTGALAWFLERDAHKRSVEPAIFLMVVAGFWKHNIITIPASVLLWLAVRDGRRAIWFFVFVTCCVLSGLTICVFLYGPHNFVSNMLVPRVFTPFRMLTAVGRLQFVLPALLIWAVWAWRARKTRPAQFTALLIGVGLVVHIIQWSVDGVNSNSQFDLDIAAAIGLGLAYEHAKIPGWSKRAAQTLVIAIVAARLALTAHLESALILFDPNYRRLIYNHAATAKKEAERVSHVPGLVYCSIKLVCRMAGKPFIFDDFKVQQLFLTGAISIAGQSVPSPEWGIDLLKILREHKIIYLSIDPRAGAESINREWPAHFLFGEKWD
jgi:hypothetical protein